MGKLRPKYLKDDALFAQICNGVHVFDTKAFNPGSVYYKQLPVAFYQKIFEIKQWKYIIFVTGKNNTNSKNMVLPKSTSFQTDLHIMACASHSVSASSTMS
jgi:hypothetical protein